MEGNGWKLIDSAPDEVDVLVAGPKYMAVAKREDGVWRISAPLFECFYPELQIDPTHWRYEPAFDQPGYAYGYETDVWLTWRPDYGRPTVPDGTLVKVMLRNGWQLPAEPVEKISWHPGKTASSDIQCVMIVERGEP